MSPHRAAATADTARGTAAPPSLGFDAAWAHPLLGRLLRDQSRRQRLDRRHPWLLDTAVVLIVVAVSLPDLLWGNGASPFGDTDARDELPSAVPFAVAAALAIPLWWRRRSPAVTYFVIAAVSLVQWSLGLWLPAGIGALIALYTLARNGSLRVLGWAAALTVVELLLAVFVLVPIEHPLLGSFFLLGTATAAIAVGLTRALIDAVRQQRTARPLHRTSGLDTLTGRERDVLIAVASGWSNAEIAEWLSIAPTTVKPT